MSGKPWEQGRPRQRPDRPSFADDPLPSFAPTRVRPRGRRTWTVFGSISTIGTVLTVLIIFSPLSLPRLSTEEVRASRVSDVIQQPASTPSASSGTNPSASGLMSPPQDVAALTDRARSFTVTISCAGEEGLAGRAGQGGDADGPYTGSGWPLDPTDLGARGFESGTTIVTNAHVVAPCIGEPFVMLSDGRVLVARIVGVDGDPDDHGQPDLALLHVAERLPTLPIDREIVVGQWVMAAGSPFGLSGTVTFGAIANIIEHNVLTDAAIGPGNSGGPLFDSAGRVVGINKANFVEFPGLSVADRVDALCFRLLVCS